jgi:hypothetical protein
MCACLSIFMKQFSSFWTDFDEVLWWRLLLKPAYKIQVSLNLHKITDSTIIRLLLLLIGTQGMALKVEYFAVTGSLFCIVFCMCRWHFVIAFCRCGCTGSVSTAGIYGTG